MARVNGMPFTASPDPSPTGSQFALQMQSGRSASTASTANANAQKHPHVKELSLDTGYKGPIIPPSTKERAKQRTLVLCFDGTGDQFDNDNSNVVQFFSLLSKGDGKQQLVYYQAGIGTYTIPQIATPIASKVRKTLDMALGGSLHHHIMGGYEFLMERYRTGDRICIFGFSRGAYTARALAGMIEKVGLLPAGNHQQVPFAYKMYMKDDDLGWQQSVLFKKSFSMDVDIEFVGVWDTVASVGLIPHHVPFTKNNTCVKTFRHALALDEHRVKFKASLFDRIANVESQNKDFEYTPFSQHEKNWKKRFFGKKKLTSAGVEVDLSLEEMKGDDSFNRGSKLQEKYTDKTKKTDVLEVWFAGCHTDVGGGSVANETRYSLARIPLRWMIRQCFLTQSGIQFAAGRLHEVGLDAHALYPIVKPRPLPLSVEGVSFDEKLNTVKGKKGKTKKSKLTTKGTHNAGHMCPGCTTAPDPGPDFSANGDRGETRDGASEVGTIKPDSLITEIGTTVNSNRDNQGQEQGEVQEEQEQPVNEEHEELHDALSPAFDQLALKWGWWILELLPLVHRHPRADGTSVKVISINNGRPRVVPPAHQEKRGMKVHRSVQMRMEAEAEALKLSRKYKPRVKFHSKPTWVD